MSGPEGRLAKRQPSPGRAGVNYDAAPRRRHSHVSHSYTNNHVDVVYGTYNRRDLIPPGFEKRLYSFIAEIGREHKIPLLAAGGMLNHSHLLFLLPPTMTLAKAVNTFKTNSSRFLRKQRIEFNWQTGYGAFAVSASQIDTVIAYIRNQREHHKKRSFEQEFLTMLKKARIPYDPKYVFG